MSNWKHDATLLERIGELDESIDYLYMVDSYGGVFPDDVEHIIAMVKEQTSLPLGFHGHNNIGMALVNSLKAIEHEVEIIDATMTGMGRGAGNLKTELLLAVMNERDNLSVDFDVLSDIVNEFEVLQNHYRWGTSLPYMFSGINSLPQKDVMEWVTKRFYSFNSIIRALSNKKDGLRDNKQLPIFKPNKQFDTALIVGGGLSAEEHKNGVSVLLRSLENPCIIHASSKNAKVFENESTCQYFCLVGNEGRRLESVFSSLDNFASSCVLPPFPRKMGTYIPTTILGNTYELKDITFSELLNDSHTVLALQTAINLGVSQIYLIGYDGYKEGLRTEIEWGLTVENNNLFKDFKQNTNIEITSLVPTNYEELRVRSIYSFISNRKEE
jgi:4-hydroxy 2-oxovalerate aldolase